MRRLVRWHRRHPGRPGARPVAAATALVIVCAATIQFAATAQTSISTTSAAPLTGAQGATGRVARIIAGGSSALADGVTWRLVHARIPGSLTLAFAMPRALERARAHVQDARSRAAAADRATGATPVVSRERAQKRAAVRRAEQRQKERKAQARRRAAERRAEQRAEQRRAERRAEQRRADRRAAIERARRRAKERARQRSSGGAGWRVAPVVTWYGPGFYGNRTACGVRYSRTIVGVAHRTLPCGTLVEFKWHGIRAVAPVIDRGPFAGSAYVFDLSAAMACDVLKPAGVSNACFTRYDVKYRVVGSVKLKSYLRRQ